LLDGEAGPARALSAQQLLVLSDRIERQFAQRARAERRFSPRRLLLAGALCAASAAAAVYGVGVLRHDAAEPAASSSVGSNPIAPTTAGSTGATEAPALLPPEVAPPAAVPPSGAPPLGVVPGAPPAPGLDERPAELPATAPKSITPPLAKPNVSRSAVADRLAAANALRARHRYREALALYLQVIEIAPNGMQASVARVAAAEMRLEQFGDVAGAERLYREARTQGGELTAEAQFGLAQVARARADAAGERRALQDFLLRHPESPLVSAARRRLHTLGAE
jgi:tetratricopeptide (TPR) repeat protein